MAGRLQNPLDKFQSYSTHFVMLACRTTEQARLFANNHASSTAEQERVARETLQAIDNTKALGEAVVFGQSRDDVFLVLDTRRFSQFTVDTLRYDVMLNGISSGASHANLATDVEMTILDSVGISFINFMQWLMDEKMKTNFDGMIFLLRVIFVGHNNAMRSEVVQSATIPMHLTKMEVNLDYAKGMYSCTFMPNINFDVNHNKRWLNIGSATTYFTGGANKLGDLVDSFMNRLNAESAKFYADFSKHMQAGGRATTNGRYGRRVEYLITIPDDWRRFDVTGSGVNEAIERDFRDERVKKEAAAKEQAEAKKAQQDAGAASGETSTETHAKNTYVTVDSGTTITRVLDIIFAQVDSIKKYANTQQLTGDNKLNFYKYVVGITSNAETFQVQVHVVPFNVPNIEPPAKSERNQQIARNNDATYEFVNRGDGIPLRLPRNYFELDYIFTGKNLDILNFDMKIENLQFLLASNIKVSNGEIFAVSAEGQSESQDIKRAAGVQDLIFAREYDPILIPQLSEAERSAFANYIPARNEARMKDIVANSQQFTKNLSSFYANSPITIELTLRGNPDIMMKFSDQRPMELNTITTDGQQGVSTVSSAQSVDARGRFETDMLAKNKGISRNTNGTFSVARPLGDDAYFSSPVFAKINIMGPNVDPRTSEFIADKDFATEVLQDNYYVVFKVSNVFERGTFTQNLQLWAHNTFGLNKLTDDQVKQGRL